MIVDARRIIGVVCLVAGAALFAVGVDASDGLSAQHFADLTGWCMVGGVASAVVGLLLLALGSRPSERRASRETNPRA